MASAAQTIANRLNAQKSTGPRTPEGKAVVSQNAVKHGLLAEQVVLLQFERVQSFRFLQERASDYSDIYELVCQEAGEDAFEFISRIHRGPGRECTDNLRIICSALTCIELDR